jgi:polyribonucleotide nucleotidyltransferase
MQKSHTSEPLPRESEIYRGKVVKIEDFGAFVEMEGFRNHGLVHVSQISTTRVESPRDVVSVGEAVFVKVLSIEEDTGRRPKIALSMKYCDQSTGEDKDRNCVDYEQENRRRQPRSSGLL